MTESGGEVTPNAHGPSHKSRFDFLVAGKVGSDNSVNLVIAQVLRTEDPQALRPPCGREPQGGTWGVDETPT